MQSKRNRSQPIESKLARFRCREEEMSVAKICELSGMSRKTHYKWRKRYKEEGVERLSEHDRRPKRLARLTPEPRFAAGNVNQRDFPCTPDRRYSSSRAWLVTTCPISRWSNPCKVLRPNGVR